MTKVATPLASKVGSLGSSGRSQFWLGLSLSADNARRVHLFIYFLMQYPEQLQCNITAGQPGTNKWTLTVAQPVHKKSNAKNTKARLLTWLVTSQICWQVNVFKRLAESSLRTEADRVRQRIPNIDKLHAKSFGEYILGTPCLVQLANVAPCIKVWIKKTINISVY